MAKRKKDKAAPRSRKHKPIPEIEPGAAEVTEAAEVVPDQALEAVREAERFGLAKKDGRGNVFIGTLNVIVSPFREIVDPVRKVCYEPFLERYEHKYRRKYPKHHTKVWLLDMFLLVLAGALAALGLFAYFLLPLMPQAKIVYLETTSPVRLVSGQLTTMAVSYRNDSDQPLADARFRLELPDGFVPDPEELEAEAETEAISYEVSATGQTVKLFDLGTIEPHGQGQLAASGRLYGPVGSRQELIGTMHFWRAGDTHARRQVTSHTWLVEESEFRVALRPEEDIVRGRRVSISIPYANLSERPLNTRIRLQPPDDFVITGSQPVSFQPNEWRLGQLEPGSNGNITVYGYFRSGAAKPAVPAFTAQAWVEDQDDFHLIADIRQSIETLSGGFELEQTLVSPAGAAAVNPGDSLRLVIRYRNGGRQTLQAVQIDLEADEAWLAGRPQLRWDSLNNPELASLPPGASGSLAVSLKLADQLPELAAGATPSLDLRTVAKYFLEDSPTRPVLAETASLNLAVNTDLNLEAAALYWTKDGDQVGSGPQPPQVGRTTKYRVVVQVSSSVNRTDETVFEASLPPAVDWTGRYSVTLGHPPAYLPAERRLVWNIGSLPPKHDSPESGASFEISVTPESGADQPVLLKDMRLCGLDSATGVRVCTKLDKVGF